MKTLIKIVLFSTIALYFASCNLERFPSTAIAVDDSFQTMNDAKKQANGLYAFFRGRTSGFFLYTTEQQSDLFNATLGFGNRGGNPHRMDSEWGDADYAVRDVWSNIYSSIAQTNNFIDNIDNVATESAADEALIKRYKGEAHFFRAWYYHMLVKTYGEDYEPNTASQEMGVPLVLTFDVNAKPSRATVADVYTQIVSDIIAAETYLANVNGAAKSPLVTLDAVRALKARVQLFMHQYAEAAETANSLIAGGRYPLINTESGLVNYWVNDNGNEDIFLLFASTTEYGTAIEGAGSASTEQVPGSIYLGYQPGNSKYAPDFLPTQMLLDLYGASDLRAKVYFKTLPCEIDGITYNNLKLLNKFPGNPAMFTTSNTNYRHKSKVLRIAEQYLIRAEALSHTNPDQALIVLNNLRAARGAAAVSIADLQTEIRNEWIREMVGEGVRIDCLKRWKLGYIGRAPQSADPVFSGANYVGRVVPANYYKFTWPVPRNEMSTNKNMVQNPRWLSQN